MPSLRERLGIRTKKKTTMAPATMGGLQSGTNSPSDASATILPVREEEEVEAPSQTHSEASPADPQPVSSATVDDASPSPMWEHAYQKLGAEKASLVKAYDALLSKHAALDLGFTEATAITPLNRQKVMRKIVDNGQQRLAESRAKYTIAGEEFVVIEQVANVSRLLTKFKEFIAEAIKASPQASIAWAGVSVILPLFTNPSTVEAANKIGFAYVVSRMSFYIGLESLLVPRRLYLHEDLRKELDTSLVNLYTTLIQFHIECCLRFYRGSVSRTARDMVKYDDWEALLKAVKDAEAIVRTNFQDINNAVIRTGVETLEDTATKTYDVLQNQIIIATETRDAMKEHAVISSQQLDATKGLDGHLAAIAQSTRALRVKTEALNLHVVHEAQYDSADTESGPKCLESTRISIRRKIISWAKSDDGPNIIWLNGPAGSGKSTIARTVADKLASDSVLAAGYFFKRGHRGRNGMSRVLTTLTDQIVSNIEGFSIYVAESLGTLDKDALEKKSLHAQFDLLFSTPLQRLQATSGSQQTRTIIIDALDESTEQQNTCSLLTHLCRLSDTQPRFNILITSRATVLFEELFVTLADAGLKYHVLRLHEEFAEETRQDMETYVREKFEEIRKRRRVKRDPWPEEEDIQSLISRASTPSPLFVYASTLFLFIDGRSSPPSQLDKWLKVLSTSSDQLQEIYLPILADAFRDYDGDQLRDATKILQAVVLVTTPLSASDLADLLAIDLDTVHEVLRQLHAVLLQSEDSHTPVSLHHKSFSDFLLSAQGAAHQAGEYRIDSRSAYEMLAYNCLTRLDKGLQRDILSLGDFSQHIKDIMEGDLAVITKGVQYACRSWVQHVVEAKLLEYDTEVVESFLRGHFLHWLECLIWIGSFDRAVSDIIVLKTQAMMCLRSSSYLMSFLLDAHAFTPTLNAYVLEFPLQIYSTGLLFSPTSSLIRNTFWHECAFKAVKAVGLQSESNTGVQMRLYGASRFLAFSTDNMLLACVMSWNKIDIYDVRSGLKVQIIEPETKVDAVVFSPDSKTIAALVEGGTICFWAVDSGLQSGAIDNIPNLLTRFNDHERASTAVHQLLCFPDDGLAWDVKKWEQTRIVPRLQRQGASNLRDGHMKLYGHLNYCFQVFSDDGVLVASPTADCSILVWHARTGHMKLKIPAYKHRIEFLQLSPDYIMAWSVYCKEDGLGPYTSVYDVATGFQVLELNVSRELPTYYPDGAQFLQKKKCLLLSDEDGPCLWNLESKTVTSSQLDLFLPRRMVFSADGSQFAMIIRIWKLQIFPVTWAGASTTLPFFSQGHDSFSEVRAIRTVKVSSQGIVALFHGDNLEFRDIISWNPLFRDSSMRKSLVHDGILEFSGDGNRVAYVDERGTITVRETQTFDVIFTSSSHEPYDDIYHPVQGFTLSHDGRILAFKAAMLPLTLWDIDSGLILDVMPNTADLLECCQLSPLGNAFVFTERFRSKGNPLEGTEPQSSFTACLRDWEYNMVFCGELDKEGLRAQWSIYGRISQSFLVDGSKLLVKHQPRYNNRMEVMCVKTACRLTSFYVDHHLTQACFYPVTTETLLLHSERYVRSEAGYIDVEAGVEDLCPPTQILGEVFCRHGWLVSQNRRVALVPENYPPLKQCYGTWRNCLFFALESRLVKVVMPEVKLPKSELQSVLRVEQSERERIRRSMLSLETKPTNKSTVGR